MTLAVENNVKPKILKEKIYILIFLQLWKIRKRNTYLYLFATTFLFPAISC